MLTKKEMLLTVPLPVDTLYNFIKSNSSIFYRGVQPVCELLNKKVLRGEYNEERAISAMEKVVVAAAKSFCFKVWWQYGDDTKYYLLFNESVRIEVAKKVLKKYNYLIGLED